ncbi:hypothetical protein Taro_039061 [Colocasia esculenta]|uniref:Uncharacterized protein n=1 Tax=Colocasia esculenta TaxID=4460 RepID=A0A843WUK0_COLES|nr:hypothetical protein [Colocasia esculenta]
MSSAVGLVLSGCLVQTPNCYFGNPFLGAILGGTGRVCAEGCFRIVFDSAGSARVVLGQTLVVGRGISLFRCFVALNSRSSDPSVAARPLGSLAGGSGRSGRYTFYFNSSFL